MATGGWDTSVRVYEEDDKVDEKLLNQLSKWILYNRLPWLARTSASTRLRLYASWPLWSLPRNRYFKYYVLQFVLDWSNYLILMNLQYLQEM